MRSLAGFLCCFAVLAASATGAGSTVSGRVTDARTGAGIGGASIVSGNQRALSDNTGHFQIDASGGSYFVRAPGYRAVERPASRTSEDGERVQLSSFMPKALYLSVYGIGSAKLRNAALSLAHHGYINAMVIDVKGDRGSVPYPSQIALVKEDGARAITTIPDLAGLVKELHANGIYAIARIVVFKDTPLATFRPDLAVKYANGRLFRDREGLSWTDPFSSEVRNYNTNIAVEAARAGFDEVQFDYVRFPDTSGELRFSEAISEASRTGAIDEFLSQARHALAPFNVYLSVDIFGYVCWNTNDTGIGQKLEDISGYVDYICPMLYPSCFQCGIPGYPNPVSHPYQIVHNTLANAEARLHAPPRHFRPWLQAFKDYAFDHRVFDAEEIDQQIKAAADIGTDGWMLWNPRNVYDGFRPEP